MTEKHIYRVDYSWLDDYVFVLKNDNWQFIGDVHKLDKKEFDALVEIEELRYVKHSDPFMGDDITCYGLGYLTSLFEEEASIEDEIYEEEWKGEVKSFSSCDEAKEYLLSNKIY